MGEPLRAKGSGRGFVLHLGGDRQPGCAVARPLACASAGEASPLALRGPAARTAGGRHAVETPGPADRSRETTPRPFRRILVAVDGSDHAFDAVRVAARLAAALSAKITLMTAYHAPSDALGEPNY